MPLFRSNSRASEEAEVLNVRLERIVDIRRGDLILKVLRRLATGEFVFAVDKVVGNRRVWGPLFSEEDVRWLRDVVDKQVALEAGQCKNGYMRYAATIAPIDPVARAEIEGAIKQAQDEESDIRVLPIMPEFRYLHTCPQCGGHVASRLDGFGGPGLKACSFCSRVYPEARP